jgi:deoxycytidine triphosphate deaminase
MILTGHEIQRLHKTGIITIDPFNEANVNPNSYNLTLGDRLTRYMIPVGRKLDPREPCPTVDVEKYDGGWTLYPGVLYLGHTVERTGSDYYVPMIETRSSFARLGLSSHLSAGFGDLGFCGQFTLELTVVHPLILQPGNTICQLVFMHPLGKIDRLYAGRYQYQYGPTASRIHQDHEGKP